MYRVPNSLLYNFTNGFNLKCSDKCCYELKKKPAKAWADDNGKTITLTGMRKEEGGNRNNLTCLTNNGHKIHFLSVVDDKWENEFVKRENIELCKLYYPPFNFKRTGCKGCPFALDLQEQLDVMERLLPNEKKQCELLWKPVYDEYRRIGYRLREKGQGKQTNIFEFIEETRK